MKDICSQTESKQPIEEFVALMKGKNIKLWVEGAALRYKAPKGIINTEILKHMAERKEEILSYLNSTDYEAMFYLPIPKVEYREYYSLSAAQKRMFVLNQIDNQSTAYNMTQVLKIKGEISIHQLREVIEALTNRHETLRTSFELIDGEPVQKVHDKIDFSIDYLEIEEDKENIDKIIEEFIRPFDLSRPPLFRFMLVKLRNTDLIPSYLLLQDMHHIVSDGVSEAILVKEVNELYAGKSLQKLKIQYKDYAAWQEKLLASQELEKQKSFWKEQLGGELPLLNLPTDFPRPFEFTYKGDSIKIQIEKELADKLNILARDNRVTLYTLLLTAYNVLLAKYTGQNEIIIGTPIAGRGHPDVSNILGVFISTLVLRNFPENNKSFNEFLKEVGTNVVKAFDNQDYQFEQLVDELNIKRDLSRNPIFDTMFILQNMNAGDVKADGIEISNYEYKRNMAQFDIEVIATENKNGIDIEINYCDSLFKRETIVRLGKHFKNILNAVVENSQIKLHEIDMLDQEEKIQILYQFNNTVAEVPGNKTIQELFEEQVQKTPDNIALVFDNKTLTYRELNEKSNKLANVLRSKGVKPNSIVGIMIERSLEMLIGIFGVLKSGGAYLPIDIEYPEERINYILKDCGAEIVLTKNYLKDKLKFSGEILDLKDEKLYQGGNSNLEKVNIQTDLAYVIYTSGSTGKPKGVMIEHGSAVNILIALQNEYPLLETDTYLLKTTYTFDVSVAEFFGWFFAGGKLVLLKQWEEKDPQKVLQAIDQYNVTHINFVPSMLSIFLDIVEREGTDTLNKLKYIFAAGEALSKEVVSKFSKLTSNVKLENIYGPTESTIYATRCSLSNVTCENIIPIGKPFQNMKAYILDGNNNLQPIGVSGELCLSGKGIARGYINRPDVTASKFISNPFEPGEKVYKTGDLVRWLPDGNIEYLGRIDHQVKIRGFRIELGEIETQLLRHKNIKETVVIAKEDEKNGGKYLCAYVVADKNLTVHELREFLQNTLPEYMVPSHFVQIEKLPLTPNGKVDRKSLPEPNGDIITGEEYIAPTNDIEQKLADVWKEILRVNRVGINDNFFDLGGNSLKAIQMIGHLKGFSINMRHIMQYPTIAQLQKYVVCLNTEEDDLPASMRENMNIEYHFLKNGQPEEFSAHLNCQAQMLYFIMKKKIRDIKGYRGAFLGDIVFRILMNSDDTIFNVASLPYKINQNVFNIEQYHDKGYQAMSKIEDLLDKGEAVIVATCVERLPFFVNFQGYDAPGEDIGFEGHCFLAVAHSPTKLYFVEQPGAVNIDNYIPYDKNLSVGMIDKEDLKSAFEIFANYATVYIDEEKLKEGTISGDMVRDMVKISLANHTKEVFYHDGFKMAQGTAAMDLLIELCQSEILDLNNKQNYVHVTLYELFKWKFREIASNRKVLEFALKEYQGDCDQKIRCNLIGELENIHLAWMDFINIIDIRYRKDEIIFDVSYKKYLEELKVKEEELINSLKNLWPEEMSLTNLQVENDIT